jgi:hypothetical protein
MTPAAEALGRARAAGLRLTLDAAGAVQMRAAAPPPAELVADLRQHRDAVVALLAKRVGRTDHDAAEAAALAAGPSEGEHDAAERMALVEHYAARDGLVAASEHCPPSWVGAAPAPGARSVSSSRLPR